MDSTPGFYAPIQGELARVAENLRGLAGSAPSAMQPLLGHVLQGRGKWVRPAITILASRLRPGPTEAAIHMATAVELLHLATLIHDDTVDNAEVRRGRATLSSIFGPQVAVLVGDYLFAASATFVCDTGNIRVVRRFSETIMDLSAGELTERITAYDWTQTRQQYLDRIYNKTGSLFATAAESGAVLSGAPEEGIQGLRSFGISLGIAFQVVDDILDFEGTAAEVGKPVGSDLAQGVLTLPALLLLERGADSNPVAALCRSPQPREHLDDTVRAIRESGVITEARGIADEFRSKALQSLAPVPDSPFKRALLEVAAYVLDRHQ